jgi:hypothetical protein
VRAGTVFGMTTTMLTARSPEDVLAVVPVVLGFVPHDSVVMLTFGGRNTFHARVDLPPAQPRARDDPADVDDTDDMIASLRVPAEHHGVTRVVFVIYSEDALPAERVSRRLVRSFRAADIEVIDVLRADGRRWFPMLRSRRSVPVSGVPYDVAAHPFAAQAVVDGQVTHRSREALADTLRPDPDAVAGIEAALPVRTDPDPAWVRSTVRRHAADRTVPGDAEAARLLLDVGTHVHSRDAAWAHLRREDARHHVELWVDLLRRAPDHLAGSAAAVLGVAAWLAGHGALAWCAVDRAESVAPGHSLARLVGELLVTATPPSSWEGVEPVGDPV